MQIAGTPMSLETQHPTHLAWGAAAIITGLLLLLYLYRQRTYILYWTGGWASLACSLGLADGVAGFGRWADFCLGAAHLFGITSALLFLAAADAYQANPRLRRAHTAVLLPLTIWFLLAPLALGPRAVVAPGYLLTAVALSCAGLAHLVIVRQARLLGAAMVATMLLTGSGAHVWLAFNPPSLSPHAAPDGFLLQLALYLITALGMQLMTFEDMTNELRQANARLQRAQADMRQMVITDPLTGCRNRRFFDEIIAHELNLHRRYGTPVSVMFVDLDNFKAVNDTLGHAAGDRALRQVAEFLARKTRDADYVFRWGGDEFLLLLSCREDEALRRGAELQEEFAVTANSAGLPPGVGLSIGCAEVSLFADTVVDALTLADERMYRNKKRMQVADSPVPPTAAVAPG